MKKNSAPLKKIFIIFSTGILFIILFCSALLFFLAKPPLLNFVSFSKAIYDEHGKLLRLTLSQDEKYRLFVPLSKIPHPLIAATLLQEDQYFYQHGGVNPIALMKAMGQTWILQSRRMGASTITMQVARMRFNIASKKISGKILQMLRAIQLEWHYSKDEILEAYLNLAPYGGNIEGAGAASLIYFNQPLNKIALPQALALAVIPQNPTKRKPPSSYLNNSRKLLFERWLKLHPEDQSFIAVMKLPLITGSTHTLPFIAPHFVNALLKCDESEIHSTLNREVQKNFESLVQNYIARKKNIGVHNAAVLLVDSRDMGIRALLGSADFFNAGIQGQVNGVEAKRSPGSTLKPFIYALALDQGLIHPNTVLKDVPHSFGSYNPENFDNDFMGPVSAENALILSRNIPAIYLESQLRSKNLYDLLEAAGVSNLKPATYYGLALTLGGAELSMHELGSLYSMLARQGIWHSLRMRKNEPFTPGKRILTPEASYLVLEMLKNTAAPDNEHYKNLSWKTGTSSGYRDAWTIGVFGPYVLAVWIGNFDNRSNPAFIGKNIAAPLFFELIAALKQKMQVIPALKMDPSQLNIVQIEVCKASGLLPTPFCLERKMTAFIPGVSPIKRDNIFREIAINPETGLRSCHIDENTRFEIYEFWPSDLLSIFKKAGISPKTPPFFEAGCENANRNNPPRIFSPKKELTYIVQANNPNHNIPFSAITDASVSSLYWFINGQLFAKTSPEKPLFWQAQPGRFLIRVVDDQGLSDVRAIHVQVES